MNRIDVHVHAVPPGWVRHCLDLGFGQPDGFPQLPAWNIDSQISFMDSMDIQTAILSITSPGTNLSPKDPDLARRITVETNDELSALCRQRPDRLKFFASLPLPEVASSLDEIDRALDSLGAVGFCIMSNSAGVYPGDGRMEAVWAKLDERKATVFLHPTSCHLDVMCRSCRKEDLESTRPSPSPDLTMQEIHPILEYPNPMLEFPFDTTRAMVSLLLSGTLKRHPNVKIIIPHGGAVIAPLIARISGFSSFFSRNPIQGIQAGGITVAQSVDEIKRTLREQCYFDLAGAPFPDQIPAVLASGIGAERILYGTDFPFTPGELLRVTKGLFDDALNGVFSKEEVVGVLRGNAESLFSREK